MKNFTKILIVALFFSFANTSYAQFGSKWTFQGGAGVVLPQGEDMSFFKAGPSIDLGTQYNFSRKFSVATLLKIATLQDNVGFDLKYRNIGISVVPKWRFLVDKKVNPFVFAGLSFNQMLLKFGGGDGFGAEESVEWKGGASFGFGADYGISDTFALFAQWGYNTIFYEDVALNTTYWQAGVNISIGKASSL
ncbi:MAG: porin family protein [Reichenbachiella sp.]